MTKKRVSHTSRSIKYLQRELSGNWLVDVCERRKGPVAVDLFGMFDLIAITPQATIGVQVTSGDHHADRVKRVLENPGFGLWKAESALRRVLVLSWRLSPQRRGSKRMVYKPREEWL